MASPTFVAAGTLGAVTSGNVSPGMPSGWAADDIHILSVMTNQSNTFPVISGWTEFAGTAVDSANQSSAWYWRRAVGGDTSPAFTIAGGTALSSANGLFARIYGFRGCKSTGDPFEDVTTVGDPTLDTTPDSALVTATVTDTTVVALAVMDDNNAITDHPPAGWTVAGDAVTNAAGGDGALAGIYKQRTTAGDEAAVAICTQAASDYVRTLTLVLISTTSTGAPEVPATEATGTGTAHNATVNTGATATEATGTGTAHDATVTTASGTSAIAETISATGIAHNAAMTVRPSPGVISSTGEAHFDTGSSISLELGADSPIEVTGSAHSSTVNVGGSPGPATATGSAHNATVSLSSATAVNAGEATATGTAHNAAVSVLVSGGQASATGTAHNASGSPAVAGSVSAELAAAVAAAHNASVAVLVSAGFASVTVTGYDVGTDVGADLNPVRVTHRERSSVSHRELPVAVSHRESSTLTYRES